MPRETVFGNQLALDPNDPNPSVPIVDVMWSREAGYIQIVTKLTDPNGGRFTHDFEGVHYTDGMHVDLDRAGINTLIRNLRRARDQAFGRDE
jgi:hypothetical protein